MQLQLSNQEQKVFENLSRSVEGKVLTEYIERLIQKIESIRTQTDLSNEARIEVSKVLEENFLNRFKLMQKEYEAPDLSEHE